ncbi:MAG: phytanoyl-CoA dioxygenase family protein, partial [Chloroflexota bacterium]
MPVKLTTEELDAYHRDGYIVVDDLVTDAELEGLRTRLRELTHGGRSQEGLKIQIEPRIQRGEMTVDHPGDGIRKIDGLVEHDDRFHALGLNANILSVLTQIFNGPDIKMFRNALLMKPPEVGSQKGMHQDSPYWPIEPMELCSCWFPLDDATLENGCMAVITGGH